MNLIYIFFVRKLMFILLSKLGKRKKNKRNFLRKVFISQHTTLLTYIFILYACLTFLKFTYKVDLKRCIS